MAPLLVSPFQHGYSWKKNPKTCIWAHTVEHVLMARKRRNSAIPGEFHGFQFRVLFICNFAFWRFSQWVGEVLGLNDTHALCKTFFFENSRSVRIVRYSELLNEASKRIYLLHHGKWFEEGLGVEAYLHAYLAMTLDRDGWLASQPSCFSLRDTSPGGWIALLPVCTLLGRKKSFAQPEIEPLLGFTSQPSRYRRLHMN
jgi:hypothetical protein